MRQPSPLRGASGFTLIEILVVMVIVGILATFATLKIGNRSMDDRLQTESERFEQLVKLAQEESQVKGIPIGLRFTTSGYQFLSLNDKGQWVDYGQGALRDRPLIAPPSRPGSGGGCSAATLYTWVTGICCSMC